VARRSSALHSRDRAAADGRLDGYLSRGRELHGITVVVETTAGDCLVGRYDLEDERGLLLRDVDVHRAGDSERQDFLDRAARFGPWPKHRALCCRAPRRRCAGWASLIVRAPGSAPERFSARWPSPPSSGAWLRDAWKRRRSLGDRGALLDVLGLAWR
jgi:hypothetical protein